jgi:hypothetical protein
MSGVKFQLVTNLKLNMFPPQPNNGQGSLLNPSGLQLQAPPILLSPPLISNLPEWQILVNNYIAAEDAINQCPELAEKIRNGQLSQLTLEEQAIYQQYQLADEALWLQASALFSLAMLSEDPTDSQVQNWVNFGGILNDSPLMGDRRFAALLILSNAKVPLEDRKFLYEFLTASHSRQIHLMPQMRQKILQSYLELSENYTGWERDGSIRYGLYFSFLENLMGSEAVEGGLAGIFRSNIYTLTGSLTHNQVQHYLHMDEDAFTDEFLQAQMQLSQYPIGSNNLIQAEKKYMALQAIAVARGISLIDLEYRKIFSEMPGLSNEDQSAIYALLEASRTPQGMDNAYYITLFEDTLESFQGRYLAADGTASASLGLALNILYQISAYFGTSFSACGQKMEALAQTLGVSLEPKGKIAHTEQLVTASPVSVPPQGLPVEVVQILQRTGYWELVKDNIREIYFTPEINEGSYSADSGGNANSALGRVEIDIMRNGKLIEPWEIAMILVHEAAHVDWHRNAPLELMDSTPNERNSFLMGFQFLEKYLELATSDQYAELGLAEKLLLDSDEAREISIFIWSGIAAGQAANLALGYRSDDLSVNNYMLPSPQFLLSHGLDDLADLDMSIYPTDLASNFILVPGKLQDILDSLGLPASQETQLMNILGPVLAGEATLELDMSYAYGIDGPSLSHLKIYLINSQGERHRLNESEMIALNDGLTAICQNYLQNQIPSQMNNQYLGISMLMSISREVQVEETANFSWSEARALMEQAGEMEVAEILQEYGESRYGINLNTWADQISQSLPAVTPVIIEALSDLHLGQLKRSDYSQIFHSAIDLLQDPEKVEEYQNYLNSGTLSATNKKLIKAILVIYNAVQTIDDPSLRLAVVETLMAGYMIGDIQNPSPRSFITNDLNLMQLLTQTLINDKAAAYLSPH